MADMFSSGVSGLLAFQNALTTTSHNTSKVATEGYRRQRVELGNRHEWLADPDQWGTSSGRSVHRRAKQRRRRRQPQRIGAGRAAITKPAGRRERNLR